MWKLANRDRSCNSRIETLQRTTVKNLLLAGTHYYLFGTEMAGISSHSPPSYVPNRYKANGGAEYGDGEWSNGGGLEMYETFYRSYNAQIGRFMQGDPMMEVTVSMSGYVFSGNNPAMFTDLLGDQYKYMDKMGNRWHHADVLEGTANEGQQYVEGYGLDGFGDSWIGDVQNGGGGGGKSGGSTDYTSQWESKIEGMISNSVDSWDPVHGYYNKDDLENYGPEWKRLQNIVISKYWNQERRDEDNDLIVNASNYANVLKSTYELGNGEDYHISIWRFYDIIDQAKRNSAIEYEKEKYNPKTKTYSVPVNLYKTDYWASFGRAILEYKILQGEYKNPLNRIQFIGFKDYWDLDSKPWGKRSYFAEIVTRYYNKTLRGKNFHISYP